MKMTDRYGYDADGRWHDPQIDSLQHMDCHAIRESQHGPGGIQRASADADFLPLRQRLVNATWLAVTILIFNLSAGCVIWAVVHFAQKWGLPW